jgi:hypothetical protein
MSDELALEQNHKVTTGAKPKAPEIEYVDGVINLFQNNISDSPCGLATATGIDDPTYYTEMVTQVLEVGHLKEDGEFKHESKANATLALMYDIAPQNALEGMLVAQMVATHKVSMDMLKRSMLEDQTFDGVSANVNRATKLQRTFLQQVEALQKLRGLNGQQTVRVEHVTVESGGQAIVGDVTHTGGGGKIGK